MAAEGGGEAVMASSAPSVMPAPSEKGSEVKQDAAMTNAADVSARYNSEVYREHEDAIQNFKTVCEKRKVDYANAFLTGYMTAEEYKKVDNARRYLNDFWKAVRKLYIADKLADVEGDFFSPDKCWFRRGNEYRVLVEPLDIANWYKCGNHTEKKGSGHYIDTVPKGEKGMRPSQYAFLDRIMWEARRDYKYSLKKAEEYKDPAIYGGLDIQTIGDARADPPKGFLLPRPTVDIPGSHSKAEAGSNLPTPTGFFENNPLATHPSTPVSETAGGSPATDLTPDVDITAEALEKLSLDPRVPPNWGKGVPYTYKEIVKEIEGHGLPAPKDTHGTPLHPPNAWPERPPKTEKIQIKYGILAYNAGGLKYLVVRVKVTSNGKMVHKLGQHDDRHYGYYEKSLSISVLPSILDDASKTVVLFLEEKGTFPGNMVPEPLNVTNTETKSRNWKLDLNLGVSLGAPKGPTGNIGVTPGFAQGTTRAQQTAGQQLPFQRIPVRKDNSALVWEKELALCQNGTPYPPVAADKVPQMPDYATGVGSLEVQGTWSFPESFVGDLNVQIEIQQVLAYAAMLPHRMISNTFKECCDKAGHGGFVDSISFESFDKVSNDLKLPFPQPLSRSTS